MCPRLLWLVMVYDWRYVNTGLMEGVAKAAAVRDSWQINVEANY